MKFKPFAILFLAGGTLTVTAEEPAPQPSAARILGDVQDGTPPPPEPPKPGFDVPTGDVLETQTHRQGGRQITLRKIAPIDLPQPQQPAAPPDLSDPAVQERLAAFRAANRDRKNLVVGATVYRSAALPPRSLVKIWPQAGGEPVTVWSSADFSLLSGFSTFADAPGSTTSLMLMWSVTHLDTRSSLQAGHFRQSGMPEIPAFPAGKASFMVHAGNPTPETLASIQALHDLYNNEHDRLQTAYDGRERARLQREAELKANPPQPKDITLNYWRIGAPQSTTGKGGTR